MAQHSRKRIAFLFSLPLLSLAFLGNASSVGQVVAPAGLISEWRCENNFNDSVGSNNGFLVANHGNNGAGVLDRTAAEVMGAHQEKFNADQMLDPNKWQKNSGSFAPGLIGTACRFDGTNYVQVPNSPSLDLPTGSSVTLEAWVRRATNASMHVVGKRGVCGSGDGFYQIAIDRNPVGTGPQPEEVPVGTWTHLALTMNGLTGWSVYVNGVLVRTTPYSGFNIQNASPVRIGGSGTCAPFVGLIDEVYLYDRALTPAEIQNTYSAGRSGKYLVAQSGAAAPDAAPANAASAPVANASYKCKTYTKLREAPSGTAKAIMDVPSGSILQATGGVQGNWLPVEFSGRSGWILANAVSPAQ